MPEERTYGPEDVVITLAGKRIEIGRLDIEEFSADGFPPPDASGCTCLKGWKLHLGPFVTGSERVIEKGNPACPRHGAQAPR